MFPSDSPASGVLALQQIQSLIESGAIRANRPILPTQIQPASLDLRLGSLAYRLPASVLPGATCTVTDRIQEIGMGECLDLTHGCLLERNSIYIIPLQESLFLPKSSTPGDQIRAKANPKSSIGRIDLFTRLLTDYAVDFDSVPVGYHGPLYVEVAPRTFNVLVHEGTSLNQLRLMRGTPAIDDAHLASLHADHPVVYLDDKPINADLANGLWTSVDLLGNSNHDVIGYRARHGGVLDLRRVGHYDPADFWEPVLRTRRLILQPNNFYILVSREQVRIPPQCAAEMVAYEPSLAGRVHYAGFFDPGFGHAPGIRGSRGVLEVRANEVPFLLEHGQRIARLVYEPMIEVPTRLYGQDLGSNYQGQGLKLSKHFRGP